MGVGCDSSSAVAATEYVAAEAVARVEAAGVTSAQVVHAVGEGAVTDLDNEVGVVGHEAVADARPGGGSYYLSELAKEVDPVDVIAEEVARPYRMASDM